MSALTTTPVMRAKQSELEKAKFVTKFFRQPKTENNRPEKSDGREDGNLTGDVHTMLKTRCTKKRGRENEHVSMGDTESPCKIKKILGGGASD